MRRKGFSMAELCIAVAIMGFVAMIAVMLIRLSVTSAVKTEIDTKVISQDSDFAARLNETIRESGTAFTMPKNSFTEGKLEKGWNYLGLMDNVTVPAGASRTGKEIASAQALVYIEYVGEDMPSECPANARIISTASDGYFIQHILGHSYTDSQGVNHDYTLVFKPADPLQREGQSLFYEFHSDLTDQNGNELSNGMNIDTMLNSLNAIQVVYRGSESNPAVALAFRSDFLPTYSVTEISVEKPKGTVVMILDLSGSMKESMTGGTRISVMKTAVINYLTQLSANDQVNVCIVPFSNYGACPVNDSQNYKDGLIFNASSGKAKADSLVDRLTGVGGTNVGDGIRRAYWELNDFRNSGFELGPVVVFLMTDGEMNMHCIDDFGLQSAMDAAWNPSRQVYGSKYVTMDKATDFYEGDADRPPCIVYPQTSSAYINFGSYWDDTDALDSSYRFYYGTSRNTLSYESDKAALDAGPRAYMQYWANKLKDDFSATAYLMSYCNGMSDDDKAALMTAFNTTEVFNVNSLTEFEEILNQISQDLSKMMWAFEGPRM